MIKLAWIGVYGAQIATISHTVFIDVDLISIEYIWTVVALCSNAISVGICLRGIGKFRAIVTCIANLIIVSIESIILKRIRKLV